MSATDRGYFGIVFYGVGPGASATYVDVKGITQNAVELVDATPKVMPTGVTSAYFHAGQVGRFVFQVDIVLGGAASLDFSLKGKITGGADYGLIGSVRNDTVALAATHTFAADGSYIVEATNLGQIDEALVQVTAAATSNAFTSIVVRMRAG